MRTIRRDNRGSITIEMCFVMPIVISVVVFLILLELRGVQEGQTLGNGQVAVYEYSELYGEDTVKIEGNYIYSDGCKREWNLCTDRLRRWQLYGDVLCE